MGLVADITSVPILRVTVCNVTYSLYKIRCINLTRNMQLAILHLSTINYSKELQHENFVIRFFMKMTWSHIVMIFSLPAQTVRVQKTSSIVHSSSLVLRLLSTAWVRDYTVLNSNTDTTMELPRVHKNGGLE